MRPNNVPSSAEWKGGPDGGYWIEFKNKTNDTVHFKIYNDYTGELLTNSDFIIEDHRNLKISDSDWKDFIKFYDGKDIQCSINDTIYFRLIPVSTINIHHPLDE